MSAVASARVFATACLLGTTCVATPLAAAPDPLRLPPLIGTAERGHAGQRSGFGLSGFDPVAYQLGGTAVPGSPDFEAVLDGLAWRFVSRPNREAFLRDPAAFLPRLGGYDATAVAAGRTTETDPHLFVVVDGRLYLFRDEENRQRFIGGGQAAARAAEAAWPALARDLAGS